MATSDHPNQISSPPGSYSYTSTDLGFDDVANDVDDGANDHEFLCTNRQLLLVSNSTGSPIVLTITSLVSTTTSRTASSAQQDYSIPANESHVIGPFRRDGWASTSTNKIKMQAAATGLRAAILTIDQQDF